MRAVQICNFAALQLALVLCSTLIVTVPAVVEGTEATARTPVTNESSESPSGKNASNDDADINIDDTVLMQEFLNHWETLSSNQRLINTPDIFDLMKCDNHDIEDPNAYSLVPTDDDYSLLVEAYVHASKTYPDPRAGRPPSVTTYNPEVFLVPTEVKAISNIGRGVFALEDVEKGTMINRPTNAIEFHSREIFRDFMAYLIKKRARLQCDIFLWLYTTRKSQEDGDYTLCIDADSTSLINSAYWDDLVDDDTDDDDDDDDNYDDDDVLVDDEDDDDIDDDVAHAQLNVGSYMTVSTDVRTYGCQDPPIYALRDIKAGEELRMMYGDFSEPDGYEALGLQHS
mmetsp:Transcript_10791/g.21736  ORF Transcript_10791/g.21736 Transcript_10791/m.21736 type:complete len:342 (+) Transcript_10791:106-1131(+)